MRRALSIVAAALALSACTLPEVLIGLPGDITPLTGANTSLEPVPMMPAWRRVLYEGAYPRESGKELAEPGYDFQGDRLAVGSGSGWFHCFRASDGSLLWRIALGGDGAPVFDAGSVITGTGDGEVVALDAASGTVQWRYSVAGAVTRSPLVKDGIVYFVDGTNAIYAIDRKTGAWRWQYRRPEPADFSIVGESRPVWHNGRIHVGFSDGTMAALDAKTGGLIWSRDLAPEAERFQDVDADAVIIGDTVYAASIAGGFYALSVADGAVQWTAPYTGVIGMAEFDRDLILSVDRPELVRISSADGKVRWRTRFDLSGGGPGRPIINGDFVAVTLAKGGLHFIDAPTGRPIQHFSPGNGIQSAPAFGADSSVFVYSNGGVLYALRPRSG